jgi:hypothetical protein
VAMGPIRRFLWGDNSGDVTFLVDRKAVLVNRAGLQACRSAAHPAHLGKRSRCRFCGHWEAPNGAVYIYRKLKALVCPLTHLVILIQNSGSFAIIRRLAHGKLRFFSLLSEFLQIRLLKTVRRGSPQPR